MEKLFDLMIMGVKMQLLVSSTAEAILEVTRLHIRLVQSLLDGLPCDKASARPLMDAFMARVDSAYSQLSPGQWMRARARMTSFFLDRRIKVFPPSRSYRFLGDFILDHPEMYVRGTQVETCVTGGWHLTG